MKVSEIIERFKLPVHAPNHDPSAVDIQSVAPIDKAGPGNIAFFTAMEYAPLLSQSKASAIIVREPVDSFSGIQLIHKDPKFIYAKISLAFHSIDHGPLGIDPGARIDKTAKIGKDVRIANRVEIEAGAEIGDGVTLYPGVYVGRGVKIGSGTLVYPNVVFYYGTIIGERCIFHAGSVFGADGFGFAVSDGEICKIPQTGIVRIGNDVEFGAHCTVDRAVSAETVIEDHCKFDDHVHIGHNVRVKDHSMFSAQVGIGGTTTIGSWTLMGGQSGVADHLKLPDRLVIAAKSGVVQPIEKVGTYIGFPAIIQKEFVRNQVYIKRIKDYEQSIKSLEKRLAELEAKLS